MALWTLVVPSLGQTECNPGICVGDPCTISGAARTIDDNCILDFGNKDVTIGSRLQTAAPGHSFTIEAGALTIQGLNAQLLAPDGSITIEVTGAFQIPATAGIKIGVDSGSLIVDASGPASIGGRIVATGAAGVGGGTILIDAASISVIRPVEADGGDGIVRLTAPTGAINITSNVTANGAAGAGGGSVTIFGGPSVSVSGGALLQANGGTGGAGGSIEVSAAGNVTVGTLTADGNAEMGGLIDLQAVDAILTLNGNVTATGTGGFPGGSINLDADRIDAHGAINANGAGGSITLYAATGGITLDTAVTANGVGTDSEGGWIDIAADDSNVSAAGPIRANGNGGGFGGRIDVIGNTITLSGRLEVVGGGTASLGGDVVIDALNDVILNEAVDARSSGGARGGSIIVGALDGTATFNVNANLDASGVGSSPAGVPGGDISVSARAVTVHSGWAANSGTSGVGGRIDVTALDGPLNASATASFAASSSGSAAGGVIFVTGAQDVTFNGGITANGAGSSNGGSITITAGANHALRVGGNVEARATTGGSTDGTITLGPACNVTVSGTLQTRTAGNTGGTIRARYRNGFNATGATLSADTAGGGNFLECPCDGLTPGGTCAAVLSCKPGTAPVLSGASITPPAMQTPVALAPCQGCPNGVVESAFNEECDDGDFNDLNLCRNSCQSPECGDGVVSTGEQCDDGAMTGSPGSCCQRIGASCVAKPASSPCTDDFRVCTRDVCNAGGVCTHDNDATVTCSDDNICTTNDTCTGGTCMGTSDVCASAEVVVVIDRSGSMGSSVDGSVLAAPTADQRLTKVKDAVAPFLEMLDDFSAGNAKFGIVVFPTTTPPPSQCIALAAALELNPTRYVAPVGTAKSTALTTVLPAITPGGWTPLLAGLEGAAELFAPGSSRAVVLLSDGYAQCPNAILVTKTDPRVTNLIADLNDERIRVFAIGFGAPADPDYPLLEAFANGTTPAGFGGSQFYDASTAAAAGSWDPATLLNDTYKNVLVSAMGLQSPADPAGEIHAGATVVDPVMLNEHDRTVSFLLTWATSQNGRLGLTVRSSDGQVVGTADPDVRESVGATYRILTVTPAFLQKRGKIGPTPWEIEIGGDGVPAGEIEKYHYGVIVDSGLRMKAGVRPLANFTGATLTLTAELTESGVPITGLQDVFVTFTRPSQGIGNWLFRHVVPPDELATFASRRVGQDFAPIAVRAAYLNDIRDVSFPRRFGENDLQLFDDGTHGDPVANDGVYANQFTDTRYEGTYVFTFNAGGKTQKGNPFERQEVVQKLLHLGFDPIHSIITAATTSAAGIYRVSVVPRDSFGSRLGPSRAHAIDLSASKGKFRGELKDDGDGTYSQDLELPRGVDIEDVAIDVKPAVPAQEQPRRRCWLREKIGEIFHCE